MTGLSPLKRRHNFANRHLKVLERCRAWRPKVLGRQLIDLIFRLLKKGLHLANCWIWSGDSGAPVFGADGKVTAILTSLSYSLVSEFHQLTGVPIILNTSFNVMGEPIIETPEDALFCLLYTGLDYCIFPSHIVSKQPGFHSILDLIPIVSTRVKSWSLSTPVTDGKITFDVGDESTLEVLVAKAFGEVTYSLTQEQAETLSRIDGKKSGKLLLQELVSEEVLGEDDSEKVLKRTLAELYRYSIIRFQA